ADEVEVGLAVLDAVFPGAVAALQLVLEVAEPGVAENLLDDVGDALFLEDPAVGAAGEEPEPGDDGGLVGGHPAVAVALGEGGDKAVEVAGPVPAHLEPDGHVLAEDLAEIDVVVVAPQLQLVLEGSPEGLGSLEALDEQ